jgi:hypothetical protein
MLHGLLQLMLVAYEKNAKPLKLVSSENDVKLPEKIVQDGKNAEIHAKHEIDVPRGNGYLRVGLYEQASAKVGTLGVPLTTVAAQANAR